MKLLIARLVDGNFNIGNVKRLGISIRNIVSLCVRVSLDDLVERFSSIFDR